MLTLTQVRDFLTQEEMIIIMCMFITAGVGWGGTHVYHGISLEVRGITFGSQLSYHLGFQGSSGLGSKYLYLLNHATGQIFKLNVHACLYLYVGGERSM